VKHLSICSHCVFITSVPELPVKYLCKIFLSSTDEFFIQIHWEDLPQNPGGLFFIFKLFVWVGLVWFWELADAYILAENASNAMDSFSIRIEASAQGFSKASLFLHVFACQINDTVVT